MSTFFKLQVRTEGRQLIVKGDRELVAGTASESKQFNREITLPDFVEPTSVTSFLSEGVLTIEAPVLLDRLGYANPSSSTSISNSSSSTIRNSPFRDNSSPIKLTGSLHQPPAVSRSSANYRSSAASDLLNSSGASSSHFSSSTSSSSNTNGYLFISLF